MAATVADLARLDAILKDRPLTDEIQDAINKSTPFAEKVTQQLTLSGRKGIFPVQFGVNEGIMWRADKGSFGDSKVDQPSLAEVKAKFMYAVLEISGPTMSATRDSPGSFEEALSLELQNTIDGVKLDMARVILNKTAGKICSVQSRTDADTLVLHNPFGLTYKTNRPVKNILRKQMALDVISTGGTSRIANGSITAITHAATGTTIDHDGTEASTPVATDEVFRSGDKSNEMDGFFAGVDTTGTYLGISRTGNPGWQGVVTDAAGGGAAAVPLDPDLLRDQFDGIMEVSGRVPNLIVCNYKQRRALYNLSAPQIRFMPMNLPTGIREGSLSFDDVPVLAERFFPPEHIGFVDLSTWYHAIDKDTEWIQGLNGTVLHFTLTADVFKAYLRSYRNLVTLYPAANGYAWGLEE